MEGIVTLALIAGVILFLAFRARGNVGYGDRASDVRGQGDLPRRPVSGGYHVGQVGSDLLDDRTGDAGVRPREVD
jgi:hypothetical protein